MCYSKWSQEHTGIISVTQGADMAEKKEPLLNELFHQVGQHLTPWEEGSEASSKDLILAMTPYSRKRLTDLIQP